MRRKRNKSLIDRRMIGWVVREIGYDADRIFLLMRLVNGDLSNKSKPVLDFSTALSLLGAVCRGTIKFESDVA
jgi:hypothetical protein